MRSWHPGSPSTLRRSQHDDDALDEVEPLVDMADEERARLHASLQRAEDEFTAGRSTPAEDLVRELRAAQ
jgi:hypothetical protein